MLRSLLILLASASLALAQTSSTSEEEPLPLRTWLIAAALLLSPLFAGWALAKNRSKRPPK